MNRQIFSHFWILAGPGSLLAALALLMMRAFHLMGKPVWCFGLTLSVIIACLISCLSFKEILERKLLLEKLKRDQEKQTESFRITLDEAHHLYRDKVEKLEGAIAQMGEEHKELQVGYEKIHDSAQKERVRASALHTSLEDALEALRASQHFHFLKDEHHAFLPRDLPSQHKQLREQFDDKSLVLDQTRRRLFSVEGQLFAARKVYTDEKLNAKEEFDLIQSDLACLNGENQRLEKEIRHLESLVSNLLEPKGGRKSPSKKGGEQILELQFDNVT